MFSDKNSKRTWIMIAALVVGCIALVWLISHAYDRVQAFRELFTVPGSDTMTGAAGSGEAAEEELLRRSDMTARVSMWIFAFITVLQIVAVGVGGMVVSSIRHSEDAVTLKLKNLENSEIFFDIPLYFGLFGTVSAFLVMTFSPQSSRLIAYSSTLIGIIFSLILRLTLQFPLKRTLMRQEFEANSGVDKK